MNKGTPVHVQYVGWSELVLLLAAGVLRYNSVKHTLHLPKARYSLPTTYQGGWDWFFRHLMVFFSSESSSSN